MISLRSRLLIICAWASLAGGCGIFKTEIDKCHEAREYQEARSGQRTQVPDDLQPLSKDVWVPIPEGETHTEVIPDEDPCLIEPPDYRAGS